MTINNNNIFGAFTLGEVRSGRLTGDWLNKESVANYGWFGGGTTPGPTLVATVDRIDFSNDSPSALVRGSLSQARRGLSATGNSNYGWFGGGYGPTLPNQSTVDRIDFSNDSSTASPRGPLSSSTRTLAATGNSNYGWFGGGTTFPGPSKSTVERIDFSNDSSTASVRGPLSSTRYNLAATGNSNYGWFGGGNPATSTVQRIDFSNDSSTASVRGLLSSARRTLAATGNSNYGWFGGGYGPTLPYQSTVDRIDFSNDSSTASVRGTLGATKGLLAATGNSNYGWFGGGLTPPVSIVGTVNRIDFSNDSPSASPRGSLSASRYGMAATSGVLNIRRQKAGNFGWFGGGYASGSVATVDRINFSNDSSTASVRGSLTLARQFLSATGNSNYGWFGGGQIPGPVLNTATVERIDFSNDSVSASQRGTLSLEKTYTSATGNSNYGWFGGGLGGSFSPLTTVATVDRINFSNDSTTVSTRGPFPLARSASAATGNSNYGWFGGGSTTAPVATVERINFSNDSVATLPRGTLTAARYALAATGNSNYGWFGGGKDPSLTPSFFQFLSIVDRIDFSNDSPSALVRGPLSLQRYGLAATGNSNYGWFGGGYNPSLPIRKSTVDRIDFSNDSVSASQRGPLSTSPGRFGIAATSNTNK
jgi:hypothetical protein